MSRRDFLEIVALASIGLSVPKIFGCGSPEENENDKNDLPYKDPGYSIEERKPFSGFSQGILDKVRL